MKIVFNSISKLVFCSSLPEAYSHHLHVCLCEPASVLPPFYLLNVPQHATRALSPRMLMKCEEMRYEDRAVLQRRISNSFVKLFGVRTCPMRLGVHAACVPFASGAGLARPHVHPSTVVSHRGTLMNVGGGVVTNQPNGLLAGGGVWCSQTWACYQVLFSTVA